MNAAAPAIRPRVHYAWIAAAVTFVTLLGAAGARATPGVILLPVGNEFQWSRATVSSIVSINIFLYGLIGPFAAALYQRFGLRRTMVAAMALLGMGYGLSMVATSYWHFVVLWGFVVGAGSGMAATVLGAAVATRWFNGRAHREHRDGSAHLLAVSCDGSDRARLARCSAHRRRGMRRDHTDHLVVDAR
jgi:MFS family permease